MTSYRPSSYIDDDPYAHPRRNRSPPPTSLSRRDYDYPTKSRSPDYTRGSVGRGNSYYKNQTRSPSPHDSYDRHRSRSPYSGRYASERDTYDRAYDRYGRERERDQYEGSRARYADEYGRDRDRYAPSEDRYPASGGGGGGGGRYGDDYYDDYPSLEHERERERGRLARGEDAGPIPDPLDSPALLPFRQFAQVHRQRQARLDPTASTSSLSTQEMFNLYKRYKSVYTARSTRKFWEEKRETPFFVEKYGMEEPEVSRRRERRRRGRRGKKAVWLQELRAGKLDGVNWDMHFAPLKKRLGGRGGDSPETNGNGNGAGADDEDSSLHTIFSRTGEPIKIASDSLPIEPCPNQLLIMRIPPTLGRRDIEAELGNCPGFQYLAIGEAHANKNYFAIAWAVFDNEDNAQEAKSKMLDNTVVTDNRLQLDVATRGAQVKFRTAPSGSGSLRRLAKDLKQAKDVLKWAEKEDRQVLWPNEGDLDEEDRAAVLTDASEQIGTHVFEDMGLRRYFYHGEDGENEDEVLLQIHDNTRTFATEEEKDELRLSIKKSLDLHLDLLRQVYNCDYYSSTICDFAEEVDRRARAHFRRCYPNGETEAEREGRDTGEDGQNMGEEQWAENLDRKHALLINSPALDIEEHGGVDLEKLCLELATPFTRQDDKEKHRCIVEVPNPAAEGTTKTCDKLFRALIFVQKHVCNKHKDLIEKELGSRKEDIMYLNNYVRDPTRVMPPLAGSLPAAAGGGGGSGRANGHHGAGAYGHDGAASLSSRPVMRLGSMFSSADAMPSPVGRGGSRRRSISPPPRNGGGGGRLSDRLGGPPPIHFGSGGGGAGSPMAGPPLHLRLGAQTQPPPAVTGFPISLGFGGVSGMGIMSPMSFGMPLSLGGGGGSGSGSGSGSERESRGHHHRHNGSVSDRGGGGGRTPGSSSLSLPMAPLSSNGHGGAGANGSDTPGGGGGGGEAAAPLPPAPRPLDPRAARGQTRSYQDLDVGAGDGKGDEVMELEY